jgi:hypothetical protein
MIWRGELHSSRNSLKDPLFERREVSCCPHSCPSIVDPVDNFLKSTTFQPKLVDSPLRCKLIAFIRSKKATMVRSLELSPTHGSHGYGESDGRHDEKGQDVFPDSIFSQ